MRIQFWTLLQSLSPARLALRTQTTIRRFRIRPLISLTALAVLTCGTAFAQIHAYNKIVVFGDSLSDTGNVRDLSVEKYGVPVPANIPSLEDYTFGRFTDGPDSSPAARRYFGVWIEQLAAALPGQPLVINSLDGGTNYAYGFATTANSSSPLYFGIDDKFVEVENIGRQITDYLATHPHINADTLFVVWGGAIDLLNATSSKDVFNAAEQELTNLQRLIQAGATQILVPNLPPLGLVPRLNGSPTTSVPANTASLLFDAYLATGMAILKDLNFRRHITFYQLDVYRLFLRVVASPHAYLLTDVKDPAQGLDVNPDTYLFWDDLHPTTRGHNILATAAIEALSQ